MNILKQIKDLIHEYPNDQMLGNKVRHKYKDKEKVPRPKNWSGWCLSPTTVEFWLGDKFRIHERLKYIKISNNWKKEILYP